LDTWSASDENIKEDVTEIENALDLILELNPKKYRFNQNVSELVLDDEYHYGFLAQELEEVIPEIVRDFVSPSRNDTSGNQIASSAEFKAVQYEGIIPILVEAFKIQNTTYAEQQELIQEQDSTIAALQNALATQTANIQNLQDQMENVLVQVDVMQQKTSNCCQSQDGSPGNIQDGKHEDTGIYLEQNAPNPFDEQTRIAFTLASNGKVKLLITNSIGQTVETLVNGAFSSGRHEVSWNASGQTPGV
ncbi:MAG: tail fiber domain-containing protein, partial [Cryomorphaceae bacterium]